MKLTISDQALDWYVKELDLQAGDCVKFFGKVYGENGFSLALTKMKPTKAYTKFRFGDITFYIEEADVWFFENHNLDITFDEELKEPKYTRIEKA